MNKEKETNSLLDEGDGKRVTEENEKDSHRLQFVHDAVDSHRNDIGATVFSNKVNVSLNSYIWLMLVTLHKMGVLAT